MKFVKNMICSEKQSFEKKNFGKYYDGLRLSEKLISINRLTLEEMQDM